MSSLYDKALSAIEKYSMLEGRGRIAVAFSGGADSTALLDLMQTFCRERRIALEAIHVEHGIRGESSVRDAEHCRAFCAKRGIPFTFVEADVPALARQWGCGIEEAGRRVRYESFSRLCRERQIDAVATAHHSGDNLETMVFNLARGSGLRGLCGIPPVREGIIRPLIFCTREEIEQYCTENSLDFVTDETNQSDEYTRNYIRHNIIPSIERLNRSAAGAAARTAALLREDEEYLCSVAGQYAGAGKSELSRLASPILTRALYARLPEGVRAGSVNISLAAQAVRNRSDTRLSVGQGLALYIRGEQVFFARDEREKEDCPDYHIPLVEECEVALPQGGYKILLTREAERAAKIQKTHRNFIQTSLNGDKIFGDIFIRPRKAGDRIRVRKMNRTVKNLMQEAEIDPSERIKLPCVVDDEGIIWIPHLPLRDGAAGNQIQILFYEREE